MKISRRWVVIGGSTVAGAAAGAWFMSSDHRSARVRKPFFPASHFQVIAHPDDDLYFFNPDLAQAIGNGAPSVTVCLTAGEADGKNLSPDDSRFASAETRYADYVSARYKGLRAAYASVAAGNEDHSWQRQAVTMPGGQVAEICTLTGMSNVRLVFLNMWQEGSRSGGTPSRLSQLWTGEVESHPTIVPTGGPVAASYHYTREGLITSLLSLLDQHQPTIVRTMDPDPDRQVHDADNPKYSDYSNYSDHIDHTPAGLFALEALQRWWAKGGGANVVVESYRGYFNRRWPVNLNEAQTKEKLAQIAIYGQNDRKVGGSLSKHAQSTHHRHAVGTTWLRKGARGDLAAFGVLGGQPTMWAETASGSGEWFSPIRIPNVRPMLPHLSVLGHPDGRWQLFGLSTVLHSNHSMQRRDVVTAVQRAPGGPFGAWETLGNPDLPTRDDPSRHRGIGMPTAVLGINGVVSVFVRDLRAGVSYRSHGANGGWSSWRALEAANTQDGLGVAATSGDGVEIFASAKVGLVRWRQERPTLPFKLERLKVPTPADPPTLLTRLDGRLLLLVREAETADVLAYLQAADGAWSSSPTRLGEGGGFGPIAGACSADGRIAICYRNERGTVSFSVRDGERLGSGTWQTGGPLFAHTPSVAFDATDRLVIGVLGVDGRLWVARQPSMPFRSWDWTAIG